MDTPRLSIHRCGPGPCKDCRLEAAEKDVLRLRQRIERLRSMSTVEMMCENENVKQHVIEWENRYLSAEATLERLT